MTEAAHDRLAEARAALRAGDPGRARAAVEPDVGGGAESGELLEVLARSDYLDLQFARAIHHWERAYAAYRSGGDRLGAIRVARTLSGMYHSVLGEFAVSSGWLARAQTLLEGTDDQSERGWVALNLGMFEPARTTKNERFRAALAAARSAGDTGLEVAALAYLGASLVHGGDASDGMRLLDEALAAIAGEEVDDFFVVEEVFCQLFSACEHARDIARAEEWIRIGDTIAARRSLPAVSAFCRTHYGGVLTAAGRWSEADETLTAAARLWELGRRSSILRGGALVRLADLRARQGRYEEAEALLRDVDPAASAGAARPRAAIHLARGELDLAREVLDAALDEVPAATAEGGALLELAVEVLLAQGDISEAERQLHRLERAADGTGSGYVRALAALSRGRLCLASGRGDPRACLRAALKGFSTSQVPLEAALTRLTLARTLAADRPAAALDEARAALEVFERLRADRHADAARALLRSLGVRSTTARADGDDGLTRRESEVLELLGHGLSNPEIAERLYISRKTVEHHVGNILAKLGLRRRAEAAAYAVQRRVTVAEPAGE